MKKRSTKEDDVNIFALCIVVALLTIIVEGCDAYCKNHHEQWQEELKQRKEKRIQEAYLNCKFEHDY